MKNDSSFRHGQGPGCVASRTEAEVLTARESSTATAPPPVYSVPETQVKRRDPDDTPRHKPVVLVVEDDPGDQALIRRALMAAKFPIDLHILSNGEIALDYLYRRGVYEAPSRSPRPDLVLLDLNLPRLDGRAVLEAMSESVELQRIPVIVLTTSRMPEDISWTYKLGAKSYVVKPEQLEGYFQLINEVETYWFRTVVLPGREG